MVNPVIPRLPRRRHYGLDVVPIYVEREPYGDYYVNPPNERIWLRNDGQNVGEPGGSALGMSEARRRDNAAGCGEKPHAPGVDDARDEDDGENDKDRSDDTEKLVEAFEAA